MLPVVALIGRTNVGKSTLFNRLLRNNKALTHDRPGVTRDRLYGEVRFQSIPFALVDTGGLDLEAKGGLEELVIEQAKEAIEEASVILLVVDGRDGLTVLDQKLVDFLRRVHQRIILVVNKVDGPELEQVYTPEFYSLGLELIAISAAHGYGINSLLDCIDRSLPCSYSISDKEKTSEKEGLKLALLGRPNVGKSSIINSLLGEKRLIVNSEPGTTQDSVDVAFWNDNSRYVFLDSAGVRKRTKIKDSLERFSVLRAIRSSKRADITIMVLDCIEGLTTQDKKLLSFLDKEKTPLIISINKVDLIPRKERPKLKSYFQEKLDFCSHIPVIYTSSVTKAGLGGLLPLAEKLWLECTRRVGTGELNRALEDIVGKNQPPLVQRRRPKFYYGTQTDTIPPTFVFFLNDHNLLKSNYKKYLEKQIRKRFNFTMAPIQLVFRTSQG